MTAVVASLAELVGVGIVVVAAPPVAVAVAMLALAPSLAALSVGLVAALHDARQRERIAVPLPRSGPG